MAERYNYSRFNQNNKSANISSEHIVFVQIINQDGVGFKFFFFFFNLFQNICCIILHIRLDITESVWRFKSIVILLRAIRRLERIQHRTVAKIALLLFFFSLSFHV